MATVKSKAMADAEGRKDLAIVMQDQDLGDEHLTFASVLKGNAASPMTIFERKAALIN